MVQQLIGLDTEMVIDQIDKRIESKEYQNFPATRIRLCQIQKKLMNGIILSENDIITLTNEYFV
jgi:hypothetical protein